MATLKLGELTDTGDLTGNVISKEPIPELGKPNIERVFNAFIGKQNQLPPMYSALITSINIALLF